MPEYCVRALCSRSLTGSVKAASTTDRIESLPFSYRLFLLYFYGGYVRCLGRSDCTTVGLSFSCCSSLSSTRPADIEIPSTNFSFRPRCFDGRLGQMWVAPRHLSERATIHPSLLFFPIRPNSLYIGFFFAWPYG